MPIGRIPDNVAAVMYFFTRSTRESNLLVANPAFGHQAQGDQ
jgi:hypothetical protein